MGIRKRHASVDAGGCWGIIDGVLISANFVRINDANQPETLLQRMLVLLSKCLGLYLNQIVRSRCSISARETGMQCQTRDPEMQNTDLAGNRRQHISRAAA